MKHRFMHQFGFPVILSAFSLTIILACVGLLVSQNFVGFQPTIPGRGELEINPEDPYAAYFKDIVLVINTNYESVASNTTMFLRRYYSRFFRHIVFLCRTPIPQLGVEGALRSYPQGYGFWNETTWGFHYGAIPRILRRYPKAEGLLWTNDDVVINYWNLLKANKSRLWLPNNPRKHEYMSFPFKPTPVPNGTRQDWGAGSVYLKQALTALHSLPQNFRQQYEKSVDNKEVYHKRVCDLFYIPRRHFDNMAGQLLPRVFKAGMISEMALPMAFLAAENPRQWDPVLDDMNYNWELLWRINSSFDARDHWNSSSPAFHPWKMASAQGKVSFLQTMATVDPTVQTLYPQFFPRSFAHLIRERIHSLLWDLQNMLQGS